MVKPRSKPRLIRRIVFMLLVEFFPGDIGSSPFDSSRGAELTAQHRSGRPLAHADGVNWLPRPSPAQEAAWGAGAPAASGAKPRLSPSATILPATSFARSLDGSTPYLTRGVKEGRVLGLSPGGGAFLAAKCRPGRDHRQPAGRVPQSALHQQARYDSSPAKGETFWPTPTADLLITSWFSPARSRWSCTPRPAADRPSAPTWTTTSSARTSTSTTAAPSGAN